MTAAGAGALQTQPKLFKLRVFSNARFQLMRRSPSHSGIPLRSDWERQSCATCRAPCGAPM